MTATDASSAHGTPRGSTVTLHDVARVAEVSLATASRVLNGSTRTVKDSYRERVETAAAELGYTANLSAQATVKGTSAVVALLVGDIADPYFGEIAAGVAHAADEAGLLVTVSMTHRDPDRELRLVRVLRGQRPRALILAASRASTGVSPELQRELDIISAADGRVVVLGAPEDTDRGPVIDNRGGAAALGTALAARGYRRAIVLAGPAGVLTSDERLSGFTRALVDAGGESPRVLRGPLTRESGAALMAVALTEGVEPGTVVFGISDVMAIGALTVIRAHGREPGIDIAVCGFDDIATARDVTPALTTVRVPLHEVGYQALRTALEPEWTVPVDALRLDVLIRESTPGRS